MILLGGSFTAIKTLRDLVIYGVLHQQRVTQRVTQLVMQLVMQLNCIAINRRTGCSSQKMAEASSSIYHYITLTKKETTAKTLSCKI